MSTRHRRDDWLTFDGMVDTIMTTAGYPWMGDPEHPNCKNPRNSLYASDPLRGDNEDDLGALCWSSLSLSEPEPSFSSVDLFAPIVQH